MFYSNITIVHVPIMCGNLFVLTFPHNLEPTL